MRSYPLLEIRMSESQNPSLPNSHADETNSEELLLRHQQFIACLESHGPDFNGNEWPILANELGWSEGEVQRYAYEYLSCLAATDEDSQAATHRRSENEATNSQSTAHTYWSPAECVLFDTLVAVHRGLPDNSDREPWAETVASQLPSKSTSDVKARFRKMYLNDNTELR
jgi:hypothetical protein